MEIKHCALGSLGIVTACLAVCLPIKWHYVEKSANRCNNSLQMMKDDCKSIKEDLKLQMDMLKGGNKERAKEIKKIQADLNYITKKIESDKDFIAVKTWAQKPWELAKRYLFDKEFRDVINSLKKVKDAFEGVSK